MQKYSGQIRRGGAVAFEIGPESIDVEFSSGWIYRFTYQRPGALRVERMKELALESAPGVRPANIRLRKIATDEQQRVAGGCSRCIREAVTKIQSGAMAASAVSLE